MRIVAKERPWVKESEGLIVPDKIGISLTSFWRLVGGSKCYLSPVQPQIPGSVGSRKGEKV